MLVPETEIIISQDGAEIFRRTVRPGEYCTGRKMGCHVPVVELVSRRQIPY
ncbi:MAG: hypothetical protein K8R23_16545 [Chthoniobacter sp.]|nr:hypothetical protein [Chthoniobacter sp.]